MPTQNEYLDLQTKFKEIKSDYDKNVKGYTQARKEYLQVKKDIEGLLASMNTKGLVIPHPRLTYDLDNIEIAQIQKHLEYFLEKSRYEDE